MPDPQFARVHAAAGRSSAQRTLDLADPRRRPLVLPRFLEEEATKPAFRAEVTEERHAALDRWIDLLDSGRLAKRKERAVDAETLRAIFGNALGYPGLTDGDRDDDSWRLEREWTVPGVGTADGALGLFREGRATYKDGARPAVVIELKGPGTDLDRDRSRGRTPVQQLWDYLNALPETPWGIVSNCEVVRLYRRDKTPLAYEEFRFESLRRGDGRRANVARSMFFYLFGLGGLMSEGRFKTPRTDALLAATADRQREVGGKLYEGYSAYRHDLITLLRDDKGYAPDDAIAAAQTLLDRVIFVAFCEDRGLLPPHTLRTAATETPTFSQVTNPRWQNVRALFRMVDAGGGLELDRGYNGGLFRTNPLIDDLDLPDDRVAWFKTLGTYDFRDEVNVEVLGELFERSITDLEKLRERGLFDPHAKEAARPKMQKSAERKRFGVYYTPAEFTRYLAEATVGRLLDERFAAAAADCGFDPLSYDGSKPPAINYWRSCLEILENFTVCDPACGSGAFLIAAYDVLEARYADVTDRLPDGGGYEPEAVGEAILQRNLYGVDQSAEAVEITRLALWLRTARKGRTLADLSGNVKVADSLVHDPKIAPKAATWSELFPERFDD
ncbi:MAG: DNA methyltransferase, partial [Planctomycetota bacterium]